MDIVSVIFSRLKFTQVPEIDYVNKDCVYVKYNDGKAIVSNGTKSYLTRGLTLLAKGITEGKSNFEITETAHFDTRAVQVDFSRGAVFKTDTVKMCLDYLACMGINTFLMYIEDMFKMEKYPHFGYMRGSFSVEELREIDDYAYELGIEVIPAVEFLGHMEQYLKWYEAAPVKCNVNTLLMGEEATYEFIEEIAVTLRRAFRSKRMVIGYDEAPQANLGTYIKKYGYRDYIDSTMEHLDKVQKICARHDWRLISATDIFFSHCSPTGVQFDKDTAFPEGFADKIPDVDLLYWDYGHLNEEEYISMMERHSELGKKVIFQGALWGFSDILPRYEFTFRGLIPGLRAAMRYGLKEAFVCIWGDDGNECNNMYEFFSVPVFSEHCFKGLSCTMNDIFDMCKFLFGVEPGFFRPISECAIPYIVHPNWGLSDEFFGKRLFYTDILYNLTGTYDFYRDAKGRYGNSAAELKNTITKDEWKTYETHAVKIYEILALKADIMVKLKDAYKSGDRAVLEEIASNELPCLIAMYKDILVSWKAMWLSTCKVFGWEVINGRLGFITARLEYACETLRDYLDGKLETIEEMDVDFIENSETQIYPTYKTLVVTGVTI